jgi:CRP-like cAMP-binding protein
VRLLSQNTKVEALRRVPLFEGLSKKELTELARATDELALGAGTVLCKEGALGHEFFVIVDGTVEVTKEGRPLATRGAGDFIGEIALLTTSRRTATVTATTPLRCFVLTDRAFRHVLDENRNVERKVMQVLAERLAASLPDGAL